MARAKKRADGRYCSQIYLGRDENGKRKYKSVYAKTPAELKEKEHQIDALNMKIADSQISGLFENAKEISGVRVISAFFNGTGADMLRQMGDQVKDRLDGNIVAVFAGMNGEKGTFYCVCGKEAVKKGAHAGNLIKAIAGLVGGGGGGRPNMAQAGGKNPDGVADALIKVAEVVSEQVK